MHTKMRWAMQVIRALRGAGGRGGVMAMLLLAPLFAALTGGVRPATGADAPAATAQAGTMAQYGVLPLAFEANVGQAEAGVRFVGHGKGYALALTPGALTLALTRGGGAGTATPDAAPTDTHTAAVRLAFAGANPASTLTAENALPGVVNYLVGNDPARWHTNVPTSGKVRYRDLYPGIDLTVYGTDAHGLEYDAIVSPGTNPSAFALEITGTDTVTLDAATGELVLTTTAGEVRQHAPVAYQEAGRQCVLVTAAYDLRVDGSIGFTVGAYDASLPLVIDPTLVYSTYLGGSSSGRGNGIAVDSAGNAYVIGVTGSTNFPTTSGAFQTTPGGGLYDAFVTKLDTTGTALVYSTYLGTDNYEYANGIAVDRGGDAYVTGFTYATNFPTTPDAFQTTFGGGNGDAFVTKLNPAGNALVYSTYLGGSSGDDGDGIAVDTLGNIYVTGKTFSRLSHNILGAGLRCGWQENDDPCRRPILPLPCPATEPHDHAPAR